MVNYLTRITVSLTKEEQALFKNNSAGYTEHLPFKEEPPHPTVLSRNISLLHILQRMGFAFKPGQNCIYAVSTEIEAQEAKEILLAEGFHDNEFQIFLEYTRKWGTL